MLSTLRALLRNPPSSADIAKAGGQSKSARGSGKTLHIIAATSRSDAACMILNEMFEETIGESLVIYNTLSLKLLCLQFRDLDSNRLHALMLLIGCITSCSAVM